jgi:hypothetical protein
MFVFCILKIILVKSATLVRNLLQNTLQSSGMWCHVVWYIVANISEEPAASIFNAEEENKQENWYVILGASGPEKSCLWKGGREGEVKEDGDGLSLSAPCVIRGWVC